MNYRNKEKYVHIFIFIIMTAVWMLAFSKGMGIINVLLFALIAEFLYLILLFKGEAWALKLKNKKY